MYFHLQLNASENSAETEISARPRKKLEKQFFEFKTIHLSRSLESYTEIAEMYSKSMNDLFQGGKFYNETELKEKHDTAKEDAIHKLKLRVRSTDDGLQIRILEKFETYIDNEYRSIKVRNEKARENAEV